MYEVFAELLKKKGLTTYQVSKDTGIPQASFSRWKSGLATPKQDKMRIIADYLGVSLDYLTTGKESSGYYFDDKTAEMAQQIFENKELSLLFDSAKDASAEDLKTVHQMLLALKRKEHND